MLSKNGLTYFSIQKQDKFDASLANSRIKMKDKVMTIILASVESLNASLEDKLNTAEGLNCALYQNNTIDSISLVTLISLVEEAIEDEFDVQIIIADEKAMSQKNSPFLTVGTLAAYVTEQLMETRQCLR